MKTWARVIAANRARMITRSGKCLGEGVRRWTPGGAYGMLGGVRAFAVAVLVTAALSACGSGEREAVDFTSDVGALRQMGKHKVAVPVPRVLGAFARSQDGKHYVAPYGRGTATLTLDAPLHDALTSDLKMGRPSPSSDSLYPARRHHGRHRIE